jgi:ribosomal protein S18 acetylase RimI-like enzyme
MMYLRYSTISFYPGASFRTLNLRRIPDTEYKVQVREMQKADIPQVAEALGKAFATNPAILAIYGDKTTAARRWQDTLKNMFKYLPGNVFISELDGRVVGGMRIVEWPACQAQSLKMILSMLGAAGGLGPLMRAMKMQSAWKKHDPKKPHWHLAPLGVAPDFQGKGIGSQMVKFYCDIIDRDKTEAYHETDRAENVPFYERFGFKVVGEEIVNGAKNWYMLRPAKSDK